MQVLDFYRQECLLGLCRRIPKKSLQVVRPYDVHRITAGRQSSGNPRVPLQTRQVSAVLSWRTRTGYQKAFKPADL